MTKPISKSKRQLAQLLIEAGVTQFPEGANWAAQGSSDLKASFYGGYKPKRGLAETAFCGDYCGRIHDVQLPTLIPNWHQTVLSRDEFDQSVAETAPRSTAVGDDETNLAAKEELESLEFTPSPTLEQQRKQTETDEAAAMRDERWQAVQAHTGKFRNAKLDGPGSYHHELKDEICDECGLRFGLHYNLRCKP